MSVQRVVRYPSEIILETTNSCNLRCCSCHFHGQGVLKKRSIGFMKTEVWKKVLDEIQYWPTPVTLMTHGAGEPLLYSELESLLVQAENMPSVDIGFMTNGMLLNDERIQMILNARVKWLAFSIDGVDPATHDHFRVNANLHQIENNVYQLISARKQSGGNIPRLYFNMVGYPEILYQVDSYVERWLPHAEQVTIATYRPVGTRKLWSDLTSFRFRPCPLLYKQLVIANTGEVGLCCEDIFLDVPIGNVRNNSIEEIFNASETLIRYRTAHEQGNIDALPLCRDCHVWGADIELERKSMTVNNMTVEKMTTPAYRLYRK